MKKFLIILSFILLISAIAIVCGCGKQNKYEKYDEPVSCTVVYYLDGERVSTQILVMDGYATCPDLPVREGYALNGWYTSENYDLNSLWDFNCAVHEDMNLYAYLSPQETTLFDVVFMSDGEIYESRQVKFGSQITYITPEKAGYEFSGWYSGKTLFDFTTTVTSNMILTAAWTPVNYYVEFMSDSVLVETICFNADNMSVTPPAVPEKQFYRGQWESFELDFVNLTVNAIYTPIIYSATFIVDGALYKQIDYTVEELPESLPLVPDKEGYTGEWDCSLTGGNQTVTAIYTPISYSVFFMAENELVHTEYYTVEDSSFTYPEPPSRQGYDAYWEIIGQPLGDLTAVLRYRLHTYYATFTDGNEVVEIIPFTVETEEITPPSLAVTEWYDVVWEDYDLTVCDDITIKSVYTKKIYYAEFIAEGITVDVIEFDVETEFLIEPEIPHKDGYTASWNEYALSAQNITVYADYEPVTYTATFVADGNIVATEYFTINDNCVSEPAVPQKYGYCGIWENYSLICGDVTVNAIYTLDFDISDFDFTLTDNCYEVTGYSGSETDIIIPSEYNGLPVTGIAANAFIQKDFTSVTICDGIEVIGDCAFQYCTALERIILPESLKSIGNNVFEYNAIREIDLPENLGYIGEYAFTNCPNLEKITIPNNVSGIEFCAFYGCAFLTEVIISDGVEYIADYAFADCYSIELVKLGCNLNEIGESAFGIIYANGNISALQVLTPSNISLNTPDIFYGRSELTITTY